MNDAPKSVLALALRVFDEPGQVFAQLAHAPRALVPILLMIATSLGVAFGVPTAVLRRAADQQFSNIERSRPGSMPPEVKARAVARAGTLPSRLTILVGSTLTTLLSLAVASGVLLLIFNAVGSAELKFRDEWAIAWHAYLPQLIGLLVTWAGIAMTDDVQFRVGLGFLVPEETSRFGHNLAQQFTLFGAWNIYLLALGNQIRTRAAGLGGALAIVGGLWVVVNLGFAGLATTMGGFGM